MIKYYGMDGQPITEDEWIAMIGDDSARRVAMTRLDHNGNVLMDVGLRGHVDWDTAEFDLVIHIDISTVLLGLDHGFGNTDRPVIFETMTFGPIEIDQHLFRYSTLAEAQAGHIEVVTFVRTILDVMHIDVGGEPSGGSTPGGDPLGGSTPGDVPR